MGYIAPCLYYRIKQSDGQEVSVQGTYELALAEYLNENKINWETAHRKKHYLYAETDNIKYKYIPDFYLIDLDIYLDPKMFLDNAAKYQAIDKEYPNRVKFFIGEDWFKRFKDYMLIAKDGKEIAQLLKGDKV